MDHKLMRIYDRVILTPLTIQDIEKVRILRNRNRQWFINSGEITQEDQERWYQHYLSKTDDIMFSVYHRESGKWIGAVALYNIDKIKGCAEYGRIIIDNQIVHEKGLGLDTTVCVCQIGFEELGLSKIKLEVFSNNIAAKKTYERAGFSVIGIDVDEKGREMLLMELVKF